MTENPQTKEAVWHTLLELVPQARKLSQEQRLKMTGLMRQSLLLQEKDKKEAQNVYRSKDAPTLRALVESLPFADREEITRSVEELQLDPEEREMEIANWAFRRQSAEGELLVREQLVPFKLVRLHRDFFLLLCRTVAEDITLGFSAVFGKSPDAFSGQTLQTGEQSWTGWVWVRGGEANEDREALAQIRSLWKEIGR